MTLLLWLQNLAAWAVAGTVAYVLWVQPGRKAEQEKRASDMLSSNFVFLTGTAYMYACWTWHKLVKVCSCQLQHQLQIHSHDAMLQVLK